MNQNLLAMLAQGNVIDLPGIQAKAMQQGNALRQFANQQSAAPLYGAAIGGDQNALAQLAQFDPAKAIEILSGQRTQANSDRSYQLDKERVGIAKTTATNQKAPPGYRWKPDGSMEPIPGGPASGGKTANAPPGYRWSEDGTKLEAIEGGPAQKLPAELAGRTGLAEEFLRNLPQLKADIAAGAATGPIDSVVGNIGWGRSGEIRRRILSGTDALIRGLTGAGMAVSEAQKYAGRYEPQLTDTAEVLSDKITNLEGELRSIMNVAGRGRGGSNAPAADAGGGQGAGKPPPPVAAAAPAAGNDFGTGAPPAAIAALRADPSKAAEFDAYYFPGASARILGAR
jgi:hypothetical protein